MRKNKAQVHILEVIIVAGMLLMALYFVKSFDFSPRSVVAKENKLESIGISILEGLESIPDPDEEHSSLLARYLSEPDKYSYDLSNYTSDNLPIGTLFRITRINVSYLHDHVNNPIPSEYIKNIHNSDIWIGEESIASRIVVIDGSVYEIILSMCYTLR